MRTLAYKRHFLILTIFAILLGLIWPALDRLPAGNARDYSIFGLPGALHAVALMLCMRPSATIGRGLMFAASAAIVNIHVPFSIFVIGPLLDLVPDLLRLLPQLREFYSSSVDADVRFFSILLASSAVGSAAYWLLLRLLWWRALPFRDLPYTVIPCMLATFVGFALPAAFATPENYYEPWRAYLAAILPIALWWLAFSASLYWNVPSRKA